MGVGVTFVELLVAASADWLKSDITMIMVRGKNRLGGTFALRWECFRMSNDYYLCVSLLRWLNWNAIQFLDLKRFACLKWYRYSVYSAILVIAMRCAQINFSLLLHLTVKRKSECIIEFDMILSYFNSYSGTAM